MGYYIRLIESTVFIPNENLEEAYQCMCRLNDSHDHLKTGGGWSEGKQIQRWFAWMNENYPEKCKDAVAVLEELGFEVDATPEGILITEFDRKVGSEDLFFRAITHLIKDDTYITWLGEDGEKWAWVFLGGKMLIMTPMPPATTALEFMPDFTQKELS